MPSLDLHMLAIFVHSSAVLKHALTGLSGTTFIENSLIASRGYMFALVAT